VEVLVWKNSHIYLLVWADMFVYSKKLSFRHYLIVSAVTNLLVNLLGVWFFQSYARVHIGMEVTYILLLLVHLRTDAL
jgi:hypothetical protein